MEILKYIGLAGFLMLCSLASAQDYVERALLFSQTNPSYGYSARMQGIGGVVTSLGADISSVGSNPAGLGFYNRSVFAISPGMDFQNATASYYNNDVSTFDNKFLLGNVGIVLNNNKGDYADAKFRGGSFAISFNKLNDFNSEIRYGSRNPYSSITDSFVENANWAQANNEDMDPYTRTAFSQFLIENADGYIYETGDDGRTYIIPDGDYDGYTSLVGGYSFDEFLPYQSERITTSGKHNAINLAWGGNYDDQIYFGGGIGIESINYRVVRDYRENSFEDLDGNPDDLINMIRIRDELNVNGSGLNFNAGLIIRPITFMTLGLTFKSPTYYSLIEESQFTFVTDFNENYSYEYEEEGGVMIADLGYFEDTNDPTESTHVLKTPSRVNLGTTFFIGKSGFVSGDVEFVDYRNAQLKSNDFITESDNKAINDLYRNVLNIRLGAEYRLDNFRFRSGYAHFGDPYDGADAFDSNRQNLSFGVGYMNRDYFIDLAITRTNSTRFYAPYFTSSNSPVVEIDTGTTTVSATVGFNF